MTLPEPIRLLSAILDHAGPIPDEWRDQARACVRETERGAEHIGPLGHYRDEIGEPEKLVYVARWETDPSGRSWKLVDVAGELWVLDRITREACGWFRRATTDVEYETAGQCADVIEEDFRSILPAGPIDRSALKENVHAG